MSFARVRALVLLAALAAQSITACGIFGDTAARGWPGVASDVRVQWSGGPGIDLTGQVAVPVRAYLESYDLVEFTGSFDNAYPGFLDAVPPNEPTNESDNRTAWDRRPTDQHPRELNLVGNLRFHIQSVQNAERGTTVTVCEYRYGLGQRKSDGTYLPYVSGGRPVDRGIFGVRLNLIGPPVEAENHLPPQRGPALAPSVDVFGGWQIVGLLTTAGAGFAEWPAKDQVASDCVASAPDNRERREHLASGPLDASDFASSPADPGWPK